MEHNTNVLVQLLSHCVLLVCWYHCISNYVCLSRYMKNIPRLVEACFPGDDGRAKGNSCCHPTLTLSLDVPVYIRQCSF